MQRRLLAAVLGREHLVPEGDIDGRRRDAAPFPRRERRANLRGVARAVWGRGGVKCCCVEVQKCRSAEVRKCCSAVRS